MGQDAVYDSLTVALTALPVFGGFVAYQHWWIDNLRTNVGFGYLEVTNQEIQEDEILNATKYLFLNTIYSPFKNFDVGLEYYYGQRINKNEDEGHAHRLMLGVKYSF
jgi:hypothetical protein